MAAKLHWLDRVPGHDRVMERNDRLFSALGTAAYLEASGATPHPQHRFGEGSPILHVEKDLR